MAATSPVGWICFLMMSIVAVLTGLCIGMTLDYFDTKIMDDLQSRIDKLETDIQLMIAKTTLSQRSNDAQSEPRSGHHEDFNRVRRDTHEKKGRTPKKSNKKQKHRRLKNCKECNVPMSLDAVHFTAKALSINTTLPSRPGDVYDFWEPKIFGEGRPAQFIRANSNKPSYRITNSGLYYIYAQVLYQDQSGRYAFGIYIDDKLAFQCTQTHAVAHAPSDKERSGSVFIQCHTGAALYIKKGHNVYIKGLYEGRQVLRIGPATFWGIVKLI